MAGVDLYLHLVKAHAFSRYNRILNEAEKSEHYHFMNVISQSGIIITCNLRTSLDNY